MGNDLAKLRDAKNDAHRQSRSSGCVCCTSRSRWKQLLEMRRETALGNAPHERQRES